MCRGCLPTRVRLQDKGVQCPIDCVSFNDDAEDLAHVFFHGLLLSKFGIWLYYGMRYLLLFRIMSLLRKLYLHQSINCMSIFHIE